MKKLLLVGVVGLSALLGGCAASVETMGGPNGETLMSVNCSAKFHDWGSCVKAVAETCSKEGKGYNIIQRNSENSSGSYSYIDVNTGMAQSNSYSNTDRQMFAVCAPFQ